jgi:murein DD-endopeptidase MepM/ murein hydrolase activator NlpD
LADRGVVEPIAVESHLRRGQTLSEVLEGFGLESAESLAAAEALAEYLDVRRLRAGDPYVAYLGPDQRLLSLEFARTEKGRVTLGRAEDGWQGELIPVERRAIPRVVRGDLVGSLVGAIEEAGGTATLAYAMAEVLQWDLDFNRDLRVGDRFEVLYEEVFLDGEPAGLGEVLALRYTNAGRQFEAYRFGDDEGYYDGEGRPLRKMFLRSPLPFTRITSRFSHRRFHPVLKVYRPHYGVDYGAPTGTPVRSTAGGVVSFAGWSGGSGKLVKVRHPNGYLTAYLHLSRFANGIRAGRRVQQGEVIGYVGSTGLSTAPHLDYRVQAGGKWIDPLSLKSVPAEPIPQAYWAEFEKYRDTTRVALELGLPANPVDLADAPLGSRVAKVGAVVQGDTGVAGR